MFVLGRDYKHTDAGTYLSYAPSDSTLMPEYVKKYRDLSLITVVVFLLKFLTLVIILSATQRNVKVYLP